MREDAQESGGIARRRQGAGMGSDLTVPRPGEAVVRRGMDIAEALAEGRPGRCRT